MLAYIGGSEGHALTDPLYGIPLASLYGGAVLYLFAHVAFTRYVLRTVNPVRLMIGILLLALMPLTAKLPALAALGILAVVLCGLVAYEMHHYRELRNRVRHKGA